MPPPPEPAADLPGDLPSDLGAAPSEDVGATFCATLVDEWARAGISDAVVCPGSRSTPMALALHDDDRIRVHVHHDERSGGFAALGTALATGRPAVVLTTSGTAAAELHPAVVEAHHAHVPLLAVTADRPPVLAHVGAPQTIDQARLYGAAVRGFHAPGVPDAAAASTWRGLAAQVVAEARGAAGGAGPGPVHVDLAFREPLVGRAAALPSGRAGGQPWTRTTPVEAVPDLTVLAEVLSAGRRGVVVAGAEPGRPPDGPDGVAAAAGRIAGALGWPLLVDARVRGALDGDDDRRVIVGAADGLLRDPEAAEALRPDVVLHLGDPPASRVVAEWIAASGAVEVRVREHGWTDPSRTAALRVGAPAAAIVAVVDDLDGPRTEPGWADRWGRAEAVAQAAIDQVLAAEVAVSEPGTARAVLAALRAGEALVASSSMPVRDLEWYGRPRSGVTVHANRGANGIDGVVSTAIGVAVGAERPTACLVGDVALLHDGSALVAAAARGIDLTVVVVDNDGGGIFSFLPQATRPGGAAFDTLFGTPHGVDLGVLAAAHGLLTIEPLEGAAVGGAVRASLDAGGVRVVRVRTDRAANVDLHARIHDAIAEAVRPVIAGTEGEGGPPTGAVSS